MHFAFWNVSETLSHVFRLAAAYALSLPIGWDREKEERSAGVRTFPLVALASCGFALIGIAVLGTASAAQARILEGLITGVGFIGGGAILKRAGRASGTATAAGLWAAGAIGAAVRYGLYDIVIILSVVTSLTLRYSRPLKQRCLPAEFRDRSEEARQSLICRQTSMDHAIRKNASVAEAGLCTRRPVERENVNEWP